MKAALLAVLVMAATLAGCTAPEGNPDLDPPADPLPTADPREPTRRPGDNSTPPPTDDGNETQDPVDDNSSRPPVFELGIIPNVTGPAPVTMNITFDVVSKHRSDDRRIFFTYTIDLTGNGKIDRSGDSNDFVKRDANRTVIRENGTPVYAPLVVQHTYEQPGLYNVTLVAERYRADVLERKTEVYPLVIEPGPTYDELCPTDTGAAQYGGTYVASDGSAWRESNGVRGLQRGDTGDCPRPDRRI